MIRVVVIVLRSRVKRISPIHWAKSMAKEAQGGRPFSICSLSGRLSVCESLLMVSYRTHKAQKRHR